MRGGGKPLSLGKACVRYRLHFLCALALALLCCVLLLVPGPRQLARTYLSVYSRWALGPRVCAWPSAAQQLGAPRSCAALFDPSHYRRENPGAAALSAPAAEVHWRTVGIPLGHAAHGGPRTLAIVLMTRNEWPLLQSWVQYHTRLVGARNVYIVDGSDSPGVLRFLAGAAEGGVTVLRTSANLNALEDLLTHVMWEIRDTADFVIKLDTDEFLALRGSAGGVEASPADFAAYLTSLPVTGGKYKVGYVTESLPSEPCDAATSAALQSTRFSALQPTGFKTFFLGATFQSVDLGSHFGAAVHPFDAITPLATELVVVHFHSQCFELTMENNVKALVSHGYISADDPVEVQAEKCRVIAERARQGVCVASCHKAMGHLEYLRMGHGAAKEAYYKGFAGAGRQDDAISRALA